MSLSVSKRLRLALFDCDGTLVDSQFAIVAAMNAAFVGMGLPAPDAASVRRIVGLPLVHAIAVLHPSGQERLHRALADRYKLAFADARNRGVHDEPLFPGIREALAAIEDAGLLLGVATGKSRRGLVATLDHHGLLDRFTTLQTSDTGPGKPHPDMVFRALADTGVDAADTIVIGDTSFDMLMAGSARAGAVGVAWGYHETAELTKAGALRICQTADELPAAILALLDRETADQAQWVK
ncbi:HAD family hydrolase [Skermanella stibiiresistens SB22]|uniref:HAD family hydrolase n=1 Tax=Skermanella stibiiresistens SB22 TaxID=1385369 RepID=W9H1B1_9PROT|nr:HAD-IA family hydrolase [Skermanella stibiiresistens]EWY39849.1 HAD family hydrolase [Skermanella stibiiresistens SB22]